MPRGGRRTGSPGKAYQQRTDLGQNRGPLPIQTATGQQYGKASAQRAAQRAIPMAPPPAPAVAPPMGQGGPGAGAAPLQPGPPVPMPGQVVPLDAPTSRPGEPVTAGLAVGAGAGPEANPFNNVGSSDDAVLALRAAYSAYPSEELRMILERIDLRQ